MNENPDSNQMTKARWVEMCYQHAALAMMLGELQHELRKTQAMIRGLNPNMRFEDHTDPSTGFERGGDTYSALLKSIREAEGEAAAAESP